MQSLPAVSQASHVVVCRRRRWRLRRPTSDGAVFELDGLGPCGRADSLRVLSPPDLVQGLPLRVRQASPHAWAHALKAAGVRGPDGELYEAALRAAVSPLPAQWVPMLALLSGRVRRVLLADDVGMGKTVQAGLLLSELHDRMPSARSLTVVPAGLVRQWARELTERFGLEATVLDSSVLAARTLAGTPTDAACPGETCLVSMDTVRQPEVTAILATCAWALLVVDEAHLLARGTARREAVSRLAATAGRLLLMTATPFNGDAADDRLLLSTGQRRVGPDRILVVARPARSMGRPAVRQRVARLAVDANERRLIGLLDAYAARAVREAVVGGPGHLAALLLRRRACSSLHALDRSVQRRLDLLGQPQIPSDEQLMLPLADELDGDDEWLRAPAWADLDAEQSSLRAILDETRRCPGPGCKVGWLSRWLRRCREPVLIFTEYADTLRAVRTQLAASRAVTCIHGAQTGDQRQLATDRFRAGDADVLLATDAAAEGLNLHERCRLVIHVDVPWSPRRLAQRIGRLDRIGQRQQVRSTVLVARGTNDEHVLASLTDRQSLVASGHQQPVDAMAIGASPRRLTMAARALCATTVARGPDQSCQDGVWLTRASARRGRRIAGACDLPSDHAAIAIARLGLAGLHPLVRSQAWLGCSLESAAEALSLTSTDLSTLRPVARFTRRVIRRSQRLASQDLEAEGLAAVTDATRLFQADVRPRTDVPARAEAPVDAHLHLLTLRVLSWG